MLSIDWPRNCGLVIYFDCCCGFLRMACLHIAIWHPRRRNRCWREGGVASRNEGVPGIARTTGWPGQVLRRCHKTAAPPYPVHDFPVDAASAAPKASGAVRAKTPSAATVFSACWMAAELVGSLSFLRRGLPRRHAAACASGRPPGGARMLGTATCPVASSPPRRLAVGWDLRGARASGL